MYGFPLSGVLASGGNITTGNVTALVGVRDDSRHLQISAPVQPGNSGGPLLDHNGNVVGIVVGQLPSHYQNVNFAIKSSVARDFLDAQGVQVENVENHSVLSTPDIADRAKTFTVRIECEKQQLQ